MNNQTKCRIGWVASVALVAYYAWHRGRLGPFDLILLLFLGVLGRVLWGGPPEKLLKRVKQMSPQEREKFLQRLPEPQRQLFQKKLESDNA
jgi:hypothetical protein